MNIVIVDDEPKIARGILNLLSTKEGFKPVGIFCEAAEALAFIKRNPVDVVITDIRMPEISGLELIEQIRQINENINIVILSGYADFAYAQQAIALGVIRYLLKPTNPEELIGILEDIRLSTATDAKPERPDEINNLLVRKAVRYIEERYAEPFSLKDLAEELFVSPNYLCELFKRHTGRNITEYLSDYRLRQAEKYLKQIACKVADVSTLVGYKDAKYFSTAFKKKYGMTPLEYRNRTGSESHIKDKL
jgi:YesN/AraC family two-component response regulator